MATMTHHRFKSIVDKVQVTIYTDEKDVLAIQEEARKAYKERDQRLGSLTDEAVDIFTRASSASHLRQAMYVS